LILIDDTRADGHFDKEIHKTVREEHGNGMFTPSSSLHLLGPLLWALQRNITIAYPVDLYLQYDYEFQDVEGILAYSKLIPNIRSIYSDAPNLTFNLLQIYCIPSLRYLGLSLPTDQTSDFLTFSFKNIPDITYLSLIGEFENIDDSFMNNVKKGYLNDLQQLYMRCDFFIGSSLHTLASLKVLILFDSDSFNSDNLANLPNGIEVIYLSVFTFNAAMLINVDNLKTLRFGFRDEPDQGPDAAIALKAHLKVKWPALNYSGMRFRKR
jgi:hypothetical protein